MAGGTHAPEQPINWAEKYIERLSRDMEKISGMEERINRRIDKLDDKIDRMDDKIDSNEKHIRVFAFTTLAGMIATLLAVGGLVYAVVAR